MFARKALAKSSAYGVRKFTGMYGNRGSIPSNARVVDLRSDTFSLPTEGMRRAMYEAEVGDDVFGEDPTVEKLEAKVASLLGKESARYVPTGTMANLIAILTHCEKRGSELIAGSKSHILLYEQAGAAHLGGVNIREIANEPDGTFDLDELKRKIRPVDDFHEPLTRLICVENTHNILGGKVLPLDWLKKLSEFGKSAGIPIHMDGARLFNACASLNVPPSEIVKYVDSVAFCFSKGLGAPMGAILAGSHSFVQISKRMQKALGGCGRQMGVVAASGLFALDNMVERLKLDHERTQRIADAIRECNHPHITVDTRDKIHSNILIIRFQASKLPSSAFVEAVQTPENECTQPVVIKIWGIDDSVARMVLHCNITEEDVQAAVDKIKRCLLHQLR